MRALLVALDVPTAGEIAAALRQGWRDARAFYAASIEEARAVLERETIDVVLVGDSAAEGGLQLCAELCQDAHVPVILVSDRRGLIDPGRAADLGVVDFVWRPLTSRQVLERVQAVMLRERTPLTGNELEPLEAGPLRVDYATCAVTLDGRPVELGPLEYRLLYHLTRNANSVLSYETLLAKVWGRRYVDETEVLRVHIERLRLKLGASSHTGPRIARRDGLGYAFEHRARTGA